MLLLAWAGPAPAVAAAASGSPIPLPDARAARQLGHSGQPTDRRRRFRGRRLDDLEDTMTAQEAARPAAGDFDDLLANNREFAKHFDQQGFDGVAHAGVLIVTCMFPDRATGDGWPHPW